MNYDLDLLKAITDEAGDFTPAVEVVDGVMHLLYETPPDSEMWRQLYKIVKTSYVSQPVWSGER